MDNTFIAYFEEDEILGSVLSDGTLVVSSGGITIKSVPIMDGKECAGYSNILPTEVSQEDLGLFFRMLAVLEVLKSGELELGAENT